MTFAPGDSVRRSATGEIGVVRSIAPDGSVEVTLANGGRRYLAPTELDIIRDNPLEALRAGDIGRTVPYGLRLQSLFLRHAYRYDPLAGLSNARIEPTLHQIYAANRVVSKLRPRMILADEVGLGKTVEAGLILKELRARQLVERVLIVTPASLQYQWRQELRSKFNEEFEIIDGPGARFLGRGGENPWSRKDNVICSLTLAAHANNADAIVEAGWDMVIFDEAHRVRRRYEGPNRVRTTRAYDLADELKEQIFGLLLLTATPMQLHHFELYSLVELVEPGLYPGFDDYELRHRELPRLNSLMRDLLRWHALSETERDKARLLLARLLAQWDGTFDLDDEVIRSEVMDALVLLHPLADAMVRNRKAEIGGFTQRDAHVVPVELTAEEMTLYDDISDYIRRGYNAAQTEKRYAVGFLMVLYQQMLASSSAAIRRSFQRRIAKLEFQLEAIRNEKEGASLPSEADVEALWDEDEISIDELEQLAISESHVEAEILELEGLVARLGKTRDSKARELVKAMKAITATNPEEKVLIFTRYLDTQQFLVRTLEYHGFPTAKFNGQMKLDEKEAAVQEFRGPAQVLVTTESGGEGRNFQFAHFMFNYDLPWNPMRVEQRIGRLDRIGQKKTVYIYNLACVGTVEERILDVLAERIGLFKESVGALDPILGEIERDIERIVLRQSGSFDQAFDEFAHELEVRVEDARTKEKLFADFILDRASFRRDKAKDLVDHLPMATHQHLAEHVGRTLEHFGGRLEDHPDGGSVITLSPRLMTSLRLRESAQRGIFDPVFALEREDLDFFAFGHDLIDPVVGLAIDRATEVAGIRRDPDLADGPALEFYWQVTAESLDPTGVMYRHIVGRDGSVEETEIRQMPEIGHEATPRPAPEWVDSAYEASYRAIALRVTEERTRVEARHRVRQQAEIERASRIHEYRKVRLQRIIEDEAGWIADKEANGTDRERRILPARRGKLEKNRQRLAHLEAEFHHQVEEIEARKSDVSPELVAAGMVVAE